jgi:hypothetical protein
MNRNESNLHGTLLKYKIKFDSIDLELQQPPQSHYAGPAPAAVLAARCLTQEGA